MNNPRCKFTYSKQINQYPWNLSKLKSSLKKRKWFRIRFSPLLLKNKNLFRKKFLKTYENKTKKLFRKFFSPGVTNKQFKKLFKFKKRFRSTFRQILKLEHRVDVVTLRVFLLKNIYLSRYCVNNNFFSLNNLPIKNPSITLEVGDIVEINSKQMWFFFYQDFLKKVSSIKKYYKRIFFKLSYPFIPQKKIKKFKEDKWSKKRSTWFLNRNLKSRGLVLRRGLQKKYKTLKVNTKLKTFFYTYFIFRKKKGNLFKKRKLNYLIKKKLNKFNFSLKKKPYIKKTIKKYLYKKNKKFKSKLIYNFIYKKRKLNALDLKSSCIFSLFKFKKSIKKDNCKPSLFYSFTTKSNIKKVIEFILYKKKKYINRHLIRKVKKKKFLITKTTPKKKLLAYYKKRRGVLKRKKKGKKIVKISKKSQNLKKMINISIIKKRITYYLFTKCINSLKYMQFFNFIKVLHTLALNKNKDFLKKKRVFLKFSSKGYNKYRHQNSFKFLKWKGQIQAKVGRYKKKFKKIHKRLKVLKKKKIFGRKRRRWVRVSKKALNLKRRKPQKLKKKRLKRYKKKPVKLKKKWWKKAKPWWWKRKWVKFYWQKKRINKKLFVFVEFRKKFNNLNKLFKNLNKAGPSLPIDVLYFKEKTLFNKLHIKLNYNSPKVFLGSKKKKIVLFTKSLLFLVKSIFLKNKIRFNKGFSKRCLFFLTNSNSPNIKNFNKKSLKFHYKDLCTHRFIFNKKAVKYKINNYLLLSIINTPNYLLNPLLFLYTINIKTIKMLLLKVFKHLGKVKNKNSGYIIKSLLFLAPFIYNYKKASKAIKKYSKLHILSRVRSTYTIKELLKKKYSLRCSTFPYVYGNKLNSNMKTKPFEAVCKLKRKYIKITGAFYRFNTKQVEVRFSTIKPLRFQVEYKKIKLLFKYRIRNCYYIEINYNTLSFVIVGDFDFLNYPHRTLFDFNSIAWFFSK